MASDVDEAVDSLYAEVGPTLKLIVNACVKQHPDWPIETVKNRVGGEAVKRFGTHPRFLNATIAIQLVMPIVVRRVVARVTDDVFAEKDS